MKTVYAFLVVIFAVLHLSLEQHAREKRQRGWSGMKPDYHMESYRSLRSGLNNATQFLSTNLDDLKFKALEAIEDVFFVTPREKDIVELIKDCLTDYSTRLLTLMEDESRIIRDAARNNATFNKKLVEFAAARIEKNGENFIRYFSNLESDAYDRMAGMLDKLDAVRKFSENIKNNIFETHLTKAAANIMSDIAKQIHVEIKGLLSYSYTRIELLFTCNVEELFTDMQAVFKAFMALNKTTNQNKEGFLKEFYGYYDPAHEKYAEKVHRNVLLNNLEQSIELSTEVLKEKIRIVKVFINITIHSPNDEEFWFSNGRLPKSGQSSTDRAEPDAGYRRQRVWSGMEPEYHMESYRNSRAGLHLKYLKKTALSAIHDLFFISRAGKKNVEDIKDCLINSSTKLLSLMEVKSREVIDRATDNAESNKQLVEKAADEIRGYRNNTFTNAVRLEQTTVADRMQAMLDKLDLIKAFSERVKKPRFSAHKPPTHHKAAANRKSHIAKLIYNRVKEVLSYSFTRIELLFTRDAEELWTDMDSVFNAFIALNKTAHNNKQQFLKEFRTSYDSAHENYTGKIQRNVLAKNIKEKIDLSKKELKKMIRNVKQFINKKTRSTNNEEFGFFNGRLPMDQPSPGEERPFKRPYDEPNYYYE